MADRASLLRTHSSGFASLRQCLVFHRDLFVHDEPQFAIQTLFLFHSSGFSLYYDTMHHSDKLLTPSDLKVQIQEPDSARNMFGRLYDVTNIDVHPDSGGDFAWEWLVSARGAATVIQGHARKGAATLGGAPPFYVITLVQDGCIDLLPSRGRHIAVLPQQNGALTNANTEVSTFTRTGTRTINVRIDPTALASHLTTLVGAPMSLPIQFDPHVDLRSDRGLDLLRLAHLFADAAARPDQPLGSPHVLAHLREALFGMLLTGQPSTASHFFQRPAPLTNARAVKIAEDILEARAAEPISIAEVANLTGISLRSLERSYKEARGQSLRDFLKSRRLELAHRRLVAAAPGTTVTQVLYASGFSHPGEFSRAYRQRFGVAPSETLRRALHTDMTLSQFR